MDDAQRSTLCTAIVVDGETYRASAVVAVEEQLGHNCVVTGD